MKNKKKLTVFFIPADPAIRAGIVEIGDNLGAMVDLIQCNYLDATPTKNINGTRWDMWIDDEGLILNKPLNIRASLLSMHEGAMLHGDVFIAGHDGKGNTRSVPDKFEEAVGIELANMARKIILKMHKEEV